MNTDSVQAIRESLKACNDAILICRADPSYSLLHQRDRLERKLHDALIAHGRLTRPDRDVPTTRDFQD